jgi:hypothetical protein
MTIPYQEISQSIIRSIIHEEAVDDVEVGRITYCFDTPKMEIEYDRVYTGVEHMGARESYFKRTVHVGRLACRGVFDSEGEEVDCNFNPDFLNLDYKDDDISISYY